MTYRPMTAQSRATIPPVDLTADLADFPEDLINPLETHTPRHVAAHPLSAAAPPSPRTGPGSRDTTNREAPTSVRCGLPVSTSRQVRTGGGHCGC